MVDGRMRLRMRTNENGVAEANALFLHAVEQLAGPHEFGGQNAEAKQHNEPSWARSEDQHGAKHQ